MISHLPMLVQSGNLILDPVNHGVDVGKTPLFVPAHSHPGDGPPLLPGKFIIVLR